MNILKNKNVCTGCHACFNACPMNAIEMKPDSEGFLYPIVDEDKCINCNKCKKACPILNKPKLQPLSEAYGCKAKDDGERMTSTSGGVFAVLAHKTLAENGVVCGAAFDDDNSVFHLIAENEDDLVRIKGTKYVQSRIDDTYKTLKEILDEGRQVLFSGTPCQVAGFKSFLNKDYDNLLCVDLICHGVPSPEVWQKYLDEISENCSVERVVFRSKSNDGGQAENKFYLSNGEVKSEIYNESPYVKGFIKNLYVRPSCFDCQFKGIKRCSDITVGDFWSVKEYFPDFTDNKGVSAIIIHNNTGKQRFNDISDCLDVVKATPEQISLWNECLLQSTSYNPLRETFFERQNEESVVSLIGELVIGSEKNVEAYKPSFSEKVKNKLKFLIKG